MQRQNTTFPFPAELLFNVPDEGACSALLDQSQNGLSKKLRNHRKTALTQAKLSMMQMSVLPE